MSKLNDYIKEIAEQFPNPITNDAGVDRPMNDSEKADWYRLCAENKIANEQKGLEEQQRVIQRQTLLNKLGITEEDAKLLLS